MEQNGQHELVLHRGNVAQLGIEWNHKLLKVNVSSKLFFTMELAYPAHKRNHHLARYLTVLQHHYKRDFLAFLNSFAKPEESDPLHKWIGTYNIYREHLQRFFK
jgi:hypothetical protein